MPDIFVLMLCPSWRPNPSDELCDRKRESAASPIPGYDTKLDYRARKSGNKD